VSGRDANQGFTVELVLDVLARDEAEAEKIGRAAARRSLQAAAVRGAVVADVRPDDSFEERQPDA